MPPYTRQSEPPLILEADGSVRPGRTVAPSEPVRPVVDQVRLSFVRIDHQVRLQFGGTEVVIETPFTLSAGEHEYQLDPGNRADLGPLLALYPDDLHELQVFADATLRLVFESGAQLTVPPAPRYEAWQVAGPGTRLVLCLPGGSGVSVWD